jgi:hypothetical protein
MSGPLYWGNDARLTLIFLATFGTATTAEWAVRMTITLLDWNKQL